RNDAQRQQLRTYFQSITPPLAQLQQQIAGTEQALRNLESTLPRMLATRTVEPRVVRVLPRGNWMDESGEVVMPGVPGFLPQPPAKDGRLTRLDLADWLVSTENPLTARTLVNRLWKL